MKQKQPRGLVLCLAMATILACAVIPQSAGENASANPREPRRSHAQSSRVRVALLRSVDELKEAFQQDSGKVRLVVLVSPT